MAMFVVHGIVNGQSGYKMPVEADSPDSARAMFKSAHSGKSVIIEKVKIDKSNGVVQPAVHAVPLSETVETFASNGWRVKHRG